MHAKNHDFLTKKHLGSCTGFRLLQSLICTPHGTELNRPKPHNQSRICTLNDTYLLRTTADKAKWFKETTETNKQTLETLKTRTSAGGESG